MKTILFSLSGAFIVALTSSACAHTPPQKGGWVLNANKCRDLIEDRRDRQRARIDEAYDRNRRDVIEDRIDRRARRKDEAVTRCPASAWEWRGTNYQKRVHPKRPAAVKVYFDNHKRQYFRYGSSRAKIIINL